MNIRLWMAAKFIFLLKSLGMELAVIPIMTSLGYWEISLEVILAHRILNESCLNSRRFVTCFSLFLECLQVQPFLTLQPKYLSFYCSRCKWFNFILLYSVDVLMLSEYFECCNWLNLYWYIAHLTPWKCKIMSQRHFHFNPPYKNNLLFLQCTTITSHCNTLRPNWHTCNWNW